MASGVQLPMHGSFKLQDKGKGDQPGAEVTWTDIGLLLLPVVCMIVAFVLGNGLLNS